MSSAADILALLAKHEPPAAAVTRIGLTPAQVRSAAARARPVEMPTPAEARLLSAKLTRRARLAHWGRNGTPEYIVRAMYEEYQRGKSCGSVAKIFGGTRQSVFEMFQTRGLKMRPRHKRLLPKLTYRGQAYTMTKDYYRGTTGARRPMHHQMWEDAHGPIPAGWQVSFLDANVEHLHLDNLFCAPIAEVTKYHHPRKAGRETEAA
ncbi:MAG: HNH endonuclease [Verrucomicrobia bacterium]|nr:HNH endonuclease [Verrucomicrobiota bacterium]